MCGQNGRARSYKGGEQGGYITRDERGLKDRRHSSIQSQEEPILEQEERSVAASGNLQSIRDVRRPDDWDGDVHQQKTVYVLQISRGKSLLKDFYLWTLPVPKTR
jgi:hypothetical protein